MLYRFNHVAGGLAAIVAVIAFSVAASAFGQESPEKPATPASQDAQPPASTPEPAQGSLQPLAAALRYISQPSAAAGGADKSAGPQTALQDKLLKLAVDAGVNWLMNNAATLYADVSSDETSEEEAEESEDEVQREPAPRNNAELLSENQSPVFSGNRLMMLSGNRLEVRVITRVEPTFHRHNRDDDEADAKQRFDKLDADGSGDLTFEEFRGDVESEED